MPGRSLGDGRGTLVVTPLAAPQGVYVCSEETWLKTRDLARSTETLCHFHLSETRREVHDLQDKVGDRPMAWLDRFGFGPGMVAAHGVWLTHKEIETLATRKVGIAHCASSNLKLATRGVAPVRRDAGGRRPGRTGTDSVASNNSLSMLREMHTAGLLQKHHRWDAGALPAQTLLDMATREGAHLVGRGDDLGSLEAGKQAGPGPGRLIIRRSPPATQAIVVAPRYQPPRRRSTRSYVAGECVVRHRALVREPWAGIHAEAERAAEAPAVRFNRLAARCPKPARTRVVVPVPSEEFGSRTGPGKSGSDPPPPAIGQRVPAVAAARVDTAARHDATTRPE